MKNSYAKLQAPQYKSEYTTESISTSVCKTINRGLPQIFNDPLAVWTYKAIFFFGLITVKLRRLFASYHNIRRRPM